MVSTFIKSVKIGDEVYTEYLALLEKHSTATMSAVAQQLAKHMGNSANIWAQHYDRWCTMRDEIFAGEHAGRTGSGGHMRGLTLHGWTHACNTRLILDPCFAVMGVGGCNAARD